jgi:predicted RNA binding protein YcfA (HicA-like mRNA interferase family)
VSKQDKRLQKMTDSPKDIRPEELEAALLHAGFSKRTGKGDHRVYRRNGLRVTLDFGRSPSLSVYVKQVLETLNAAATEDDLAAAHDVDKDTAEGDL